MWNHVLEWSACLLLLIGLKLITDKKLVGFYLALAAEVIWIVWGFRTESLGLVAMSTVIAVMYVRGIYLWGKEAAETASDQTTELSP